MEQSNQSKRVLLSVIGVAILVVAVVGVSFAFFNYTRTGGTNTVETGKIKFTSTQTGDGFTLTNQFPISAANYSSRVTEIETDETKPYSASTDQFGRVVVDIYGETTYEAGLDWRVSARDANIIASTGGQNPQTVSVPLSVIVDANVESGSETTDSVTVVPTYGRPANAANAANLPNGDTLLAYGHIDGTATYNNGQRYHAVVTIDTFLDASKIAITDTEDENETWQAGRQVVTTDQWNNLMTNAASKISYKIMVESKETTTGSYNTHNDWAH